jgi:hypothetical protein
MQVTRASSALGLIEVDSSGWMMAAMEAVADKQQVKYPLVI